MNRCLVFITVAVSLTAVVFWTNAAHGENYEKGKSLYEQKCLICHGADGKGDGPAAAALGKAPADFNKPEFWQGDVVKKITDTVRNGRPPMPAFDLSPDEIKSIIGYMEHAFKK
ncbi:MAG: c-type cytochrome [Desulfobacterales bacterium]